MSVSGQNNFQTLSEDSHSSAVLYHQGCRSSRAVSLDSCRPNNESRNPRKFQRADYSLLLRYSSERLRRDGYAEYRFFNKERRVIIADRYIDMRCWGE